MSDLEERVSANIETARANVVEVEDNLWAVEAWHAQIRAAKWRLIRNRRLLGQCRRLLDRNRELQAANEHLIAENSAFLALIRRLA